MGEARPPTPGVLPDGRLVLDNPVELPDVLDLLIVGGGPFGTAAAFRAKELGLQALVIDYDDILKRIRDYAKEKLILPDFGGGDEMPFPEGGPLIKALEFGPIDKDDLCAAWKELYRKHSVPAQIGVELTGLDREGDIWRATAMNHNLKRDVAIRARHVAIGLGRGEPRQLEIPGDLSGLAYALDDASRFVGQPACVIGGGTSAGEAVIAISNAKAAASDPTAVFWSNRGQNMPKVSQALAVPFFGAFVVNGNVRYLPTSQPVAAVGQGDGACMAIRGERVERPGQPASAMQYEFLMSSTVACIGGEVPESLLNRIGTPLVTTEADKKRILVTQGLESRQPNVYLAGDLLSPKYLESADLMDQAGYREVKRKGNIKAALRDGVVVASDVAQKIGVDPRKTVLKDWSDGVPMPPVPMKACRLVSMLRTGVAANAFPVKSGAVTTIGRHGTDIEFAPDDHLSERHAEITSTPGGYVVAPAGPDRLMYLQPEADRAVPIVMVGGRTMISAGKQWFTIGGEGQAELTHLDASGQIVNTYTLTDGITFVGRESPGISLAADDLTLSRRHFSLSRRPADAPGASAVLLLRDVGSDNGTLIKIDVATGLVPGDLLLLGRQRLRFESTVRESTPPPIQPPAPPSGLQVRTEPSVEFASLSEAISCTKDESIYQIAKRSGVTISVSCVLAPGGRGGSCGADPVQILSGAEFLNPIGRSEKRVLEDDLELDPTSHRLACVTKVTGPVKVKIVQK